MCVTDFCWPDLESNFWFTESDVPLAQNLGCFFGITLDPFREGVNVPQLFEGLFLSVSCATVEDHEKDTDSVGLS